MIFINKKMKYLYISAVLLAVCILGINLFQPSAPKVIKGNMEIIVYDDYYNTFVNAAEKFKENNTKANITVKQVYSLEEVQEILENKNKKTAYLVQMNMDDMEKLGVEESSESQLKDILANYEKNFSKYRIEQLTYNDKFMGIPLTSRPFALYIREDMLSEFGYSKEDFNTWQDVIKIGTDVYEKSGNKVHLLNAAGRDYEDLVSLIILEQLNKGAGREEAEENTIKLIDEMKENNILNFEEGGEFTGRISSNNAVKEINALEEECTWTIENPPSLTGGGNKFFAGLGENLVVFNEKEDNKKLIEEFAIFFTNSGFNGDEDLFEKYDFVSYLNVYKNGYNPGEPKNFENKNPITFLTNIEYNVSPEIDYTEFVDIKKEILSQ